MGATTLKKGKYTFQISSNKNARFGRGAGWGDLDIVVVPKFKGVAAYNEPDRKSGCPAKRAANSDLILKTIKVDQTSIIKITGHIIRTFSGRADAYLKYQRKHTLDTSLTYTNNKRWEDVKLHYTGTFGKGMHTFSIRSNRANAFGCGQSWGDIDILVLPQKLVATTGGKKTTKKPANPCAKNNGGCNKFRKCMNSKGKAVCGNCAKGYTNLGAKNCKKVAAPKYSFAGNGKANCGKYKPVSSEAACKATAAGAKKTYGGTGSYASWPKNCFMYNNKFYYNKHNTGKANKQGNPVCTKTVAPIKTSYAGNGRTNCGKYKPVATDKDCAAVAKAAKKTFGGSGGWSNWPKNCFLYNNKFYFNRHSKGGANKQGNPVCTKTLLPVKTLKCRAGSASNCKITTISTPKYSAGNLLRIHNGRRVRKSTETDSCPNGYKIWSPRNKNDWTIVFNAMGKSIAKYPKKPHFIIDVTRPANGCGGCTKYAMKSTTAQQGSWRTKDGSAWWLRDARYNEPNGDYHANCYLHIYDVNPNNVRFNDGSCNYKSSAYLCQPAVKKKNIQDFGGNAHTRSGKLKQCQGDCDGDSHCEKGLKCFQRSGYTTVPGCNGKGVIHHDYCIKP